MMGDRSAADRCQLSAAIQKHDDEHTRDTQPDQSQSNDRGGFVENALSSQSCSHESNYGLECEPIAIIGMGCRLPGDVSSPAQLWDLLMRGQSGHCDIPDTRFNIDSFYHQDPSRSGTANTRGGYFLSEDITAFENTFFGINNREATSMDPQQRKLLEVVYECFENAGLSLQGLQGANVGCYVGNFTADFQVMQMKDPESFTRYSATGLASTILANRLSCTFDLRGPSLVLDTACSSSLYCLHVACEALRSRECDGAVVAGVNLIQAPEPHVAIVKAGILSSSSTCRTFDASADGYGRADGVGALYLKRLSDAVRDGDPIRSIIRATAINSNGRTTGITLPSKDGQESVIRKAYTKAQLDPRDTDYVECHGTGTAVGDPIEVEALSRVFGEDHLGNPLLIGSVKTNLGHSEAASGITSVIKATLALEKGLIPATIGPRNLNPNIKAEEWNVQVVTGQTLWPQKSSPRAHAPRASINSFGFGGANAHAVIEAATTAGTRAHQDHISSITPGSQCSFLLPFSATNLTSLQDRVTSLSLLHGGNTSLRDVAYTLGCRRTHLPVRGYSITGETNWRCGVRLEDLRTRDDIQGSLVQLPFCLVFSGQGAQWPGMGSQLMERCPKFRHSIEGLDKCLANLTPPPVFSIHDIIANSPKTDLIHLALYSQTVCTAVQIALVDLLRECEIFSTATIGHSSGEIGAAYAAGHLSENEAIMLAYFRGYAISHETSPGRMLALGATPLMVEELITDLGLQGSVVVACINSPESVTLSGDAHHIDTVMAAAQSQHIFARKLRTDGKAYHSPHMESTGKLYEELVSSVFSNESASFRKQPSALMISSMTGQKVDSAMTRTPTYWRSNLESPVLFKAALELLAPAPDAFHFIEVGPHPVLQLPARQTLARSGEIVYSSTLSRDRDPVLGILDLFGSLFTRGHAVAFGKVNKLFVTRSNSSDEPPKFLPDLPIYKWQYGTKLWTEPRISQEYRQRQQPPHDLLGARVINGSDITATWRNLLSITNVPWLADHKLGKNILFPAAAYLAMAAEACCQLTTAPISQSTISFRHVDLLKGCILSATSEVELFTELRPLAISNLTFSKNTWEFTIFSQSNGNMTTHVKGRVGTEKVESVFSRPLSPTNTLMELQNARTLYEKFATTGLVFGPKFQSLEDVHASKVDGQRRATGLTRMLEGDGTLTEGESEYRIHPIFIDAALQMALIADASGSSKDLRAGVPVFVDSISIAPFSSFPQHVVIQAEASKAGFDASKCDVQLCDKHNNNLLKLHGVRLVTYPGLEGLRPSEERHPFMRVVWKPDIRNLLSTRDAKLVQALKDPSKAKHANGYIDCIAKSLDIIVHKNPAVRILEMASEASRNTKILLGLLRAGTSFKRFKQYTLGRLDMQGQLLGNQIHDPEDLHENRSYEKLASGAKFDVFLGPTITSSTTDLRTQWETLVTYAAPGAMLLTTSKDGNLLLSLGMTSNNTLSYPSGEDVSMYLSQLKDSAPMMNGVTHTDFVIIHNDDMRAIHETLSSKLSATVNNRVNMISFEEINETTIPSKAIIIAMVELEIPMLKNATNAQLSRLKTLVERASILLWVTAGGNLHGNKPEFSLYAGLARAVALEQPSLKLLSLDIDEVSSSPDGVVDNVIGIIDQALHDPVPDYEFIHHNGTLFVSRFVPDDIMNRDFSQRGKPKRIKSSWAQAGRCQLAVDRVGQLDTIHFEVVPEPEHLLEPDFVEVEVKCVGLNAKDIYALNGKVDTKNASCTTEYCGTVKVVGSSVEDLLPGDRVVVAAPGHFKAYEQVPWWACQKLRDEESFAELCTLMVAFSTALYGLRDRANLLAGESVLIHSASGGTGIAAIQVAKLIGAGIYATVSTVEKKQFLVEAFGLKPERIFHSRDSSFLSEIMTATSGRGVDVVLNSLTGNLLHDSWQACAKFGRFVEIGKRDIIEGGRLDMEVFDRSATFTAFDLSEWFYSDNPAHHRNYRSLCSRVLELYRRDEITPIQPLKVFDVSELVPAVRYFSSSTRVGKIAVSVEDPQSEITASDTFLTSHLTRLTQRKFRPPKYSTVLSAEKSYIMVGCLGGLGRSLSKWMLDRGARKFLFISRSGADKPSAQSLVTELRGSGAHVTLVRGDVSCFDDVSKAVSQAPGPIGGVIQAAMGLNEALFTRMTEENWHNGIDAKVLGTENLHKAIDGKDDQLDFFIMTSSVSGSIGTATEGNYCAANHFLDNFAKYRRSHGLPATSLGLGMISEVGYLHEHPEIEALLLRKGIRSLNEEEVLGIFDAVLSNTASPGDEDDHFANAHLLTGLEVTGLQAQRNQGFDGHKQVLDDPRASLLVQSFNEASPEKDYSAGDRKGLSRKIVEAIKSGDDLGKAVQGIIVEKMSNLLLLSLDKIDPRMGLSAFGMDSMLAAELRAYLYQVTKVDVPFQKLMDDATNIVDLADMMTLEISKAQ